MTTVGIISDTHGLLRPEALALLRGVAHIVHAGDIGAPDIVPRLGQLAPVTAIAGNIDVADWARAFRPTASVVLLGRRFFVIHDRGDLDFDPAAEGYDAVISGHSHRAATQIVDGVLYLNPGSAGPRRFKLPTTVATLWIEGDTIASNIHFIE